MISSSTAGHTSLGRSWPTPGSSRNRAGNGLGDHLAATPRLAELIHAGRGGDAADAWRDAGALIALLDGLIFNIVVGTQTAETAVATIRAQLDYVFGNSVAPDSASR